MSVFKTVLGATCALVVCAAAIPSGALGSSDASFRIRPYLYAAKDHHIKVSWSYGDRILTDEQTAFKLFKGDQLVQELTATATHDLETTVLPIEPCGFGSDLRYQVRGMPAPMAITEIPCPNSDEVRFSFLSDTQEGPENSRHFADEMKRFPGSFILHGGDMVQTGSDEDAWTKYFWSMEPVSGTRVMIPAVGNHEYRARTNPLLWDKYFQTNSAEAFYVVDAGPVRLIVLNSNFEDDHSLIDKQVEFLKNELAIPAAWKVVAFHHPPYSWGIAQIDAPFTRKEHLVLREKFVPLFEEFKVDLVLNGHTHLYEYSEKDGVHYLTTGAAGGKMGVFGVSKNNPYTQHSEKVRTMIHVQATTTELQAMSVGIDGKPLGDLVLRRHGRDQLRWPQSPSL